MLKWTILIMNLHILKTPILNEAIHDETPPTSPQNIEAFQEREIIKHDTMGQDMTDIVPDPEPEVSYSANFQGIFLSRIEEFGEILNYHSNITQQSWERGLDNINSIYKNRWDNLPTHDADTFLLVGIKVISNPELKCWYGLRSLRLQESAKRPDNLPKSECSFFKMVQSLLYPTNPIKHFWENLMFESISLVSYNVIAPKPYVASTSNLTNTLGLQQGAVEYFSSSLSKSKQRATQLSIEGGGADN
ncbi:hypothetical protein O181_025221 [Austropuccinia psidii MF-1]|uniref:Uncharacterized protein n=1 Tax=Austropuccinia psidii MF-1 TaxID=1389203 RepID=A0A9Q3CI48_9BASI|nr:hypothetical protein [Austropuccinia psidii MF-1]